MKNFLNKKTMIAIGIVVAILAIIIWGIFGKKDENNAPSEPSEATPSPIIEEEIEQGGGEEIVDITSLEPDEFVKLTWEQIRDFTEARLPNYRDIYGISEDTVMVQEDWEELKKIMFWQIYNQTYDSYVNVGNVSNDVEIEDNKWGTDVIYAEPTLEYIESLSTSEFREYMKGFFKFAEVGDEGIAALNFLTNEQVEEMRQEFINDYFN